MIGGARLSNGQDHGWAGSWRPALWLVASGFSRTWRRTKALSFLTASLRERFSHVNDRCPASDHGLRRSAAEEAAADDAAARRLRCRAVRRVRAGVLSGRRRVLLLVLR